MELRKKSNGMVPKVIARGGSREAIVEAASRLFLERGFGSVSMDELAEAAGLARRTLYNQFTSKEDIFREMLLRVSGQFEEAFPPGVETQGDVEEVLRLVARMIFELHGRPEYLGFLRMVVADSRQFPWIAEELAAVMDPQAERLARYFAHLTAMGILNCRNPTLAAHQFMGILNEFSLWPWMMGRERLAVPAEEIVEETVRMFLRKFTAVRDRTKRIMTMQRNSSLSIGSLHAGSHSSLPPRTQDSASDRVSLRSPTLNRSRRAPALGGIQPYRGCQ